MAFCPVVSRTVVAKHKVVSFEGLPVLALAIGEVRYLHVPLLAPRQGDVVRDENRAVPHMGRAEVPAQAVVGVAGLLRAPTPEQRVPRGLVLRGVLVVVPTGGLAVCVADASG